MSEQSDWKQVADSLQGLAMKLKMHFQQAASDDEETAAESAEVKRALDRVGDALDGAFEGVRNAVRDPAVKDDVREVSAQLKQALYNSLQDVRRRTGER